ncbi:MAG: glycyl-radical enzyme activating protein, partial [bacterium]|nr:glycyl-radical enzyme activating protein [bacterium]
FFKGCPLNCRWCHNPESRLAEPETHAVSNSSWGGQARDETIGRKVTVDEVVAEVLKDEIFYDQSGGGVTISGGEPLHQPDFLQGLLKACKRHGLHTAVDTSGCAEYGVFERVREFVDLFLYDLKVMDAEDHEKYTGVSNREILANLKRLAAEGESIIVRVPLIPEISDTRANLEAVAEFLNPLKNIRSVNLLPYNKLGEDKARRFDLQCGRNRWTVQSQVKLDDKRKWLESLGYEVKIGG